MKTHLIYESSESSSLSAWSSINSFSTDRLDETDNDSSPALDLQLRKHVDMSHSKYDTYILQDDQYSTHTTFTLPGQNSAAALREYLSMTLQPNQITDEYGDECDISAISNDHLVVLQAEMWSHLPRVSTHVRPSREQMLVGVHVAGIVQLLGESHVFILNNSQDLPCVYASSRGDSKPTCHSQTVRMEPLVHWGTVTPAIARRSMVAFRRNGELMATPEYKQLVRRLTKCSTPVYCVSCLDYLWSKRREAGEVVGWLGGGGEGDGVSDSSRDSLQLSSGLGCSSVDDKSSAVGAIGMLTTSQSCLVKSEDCEDEGMNLSQLDGTSDRYDTAQYHQPYNHDESGNNVDKAQTTPPRKKERAFGRELDSNSAVAHVGVRKSPSKAPLSAQKRVIKKSPRPIQPLRGIQKAATGAKASKKRSTQEVKVRFQTNTTAGVRIPLSLSPRQGQQTTSFPKLTIHLAKDDANNSLLPTPTLSSKICICNLPSSSSSQKKHEMVQISQCKNASCRYVWYHYTCLDKSEKIKSRHGSFVCRWCRNEEVFCSGFDGEKKEEKRWRWSREEMEGRFPGLGGVEGVVRPYGLGGGVGDGDGDGDVDGEGEMGEYWGMSDDSVLFV